jgi:hypothetical protein
MKRRRRRTIPDLSPEVRERHERTHRQLAERIAYHEARIAAEERGEDPDAVDPNAVDASSILELSPAERHRWAERKLAERIAYHEARIAARERGEDPDAVTA